MFGWVSWRDLILAWRHRADVLATLFFFIIVTSLFPLGIGPEPQTLQTIAPGVVWVAALLASMLSLGRIFGNDYQDGTLEQLLLTPQPAYLIVLAKVLAHWLVSEVPLVIIAPVAGAEPDRSHWRGAYVGLARGECFGCVVGLAALHSGTDLWNWRDSGHG